MTRHELMRTQRDGLSPLLPQGWDGARAHAELSGLAVRALGGEWAGLFASPASDGAAMLWQAEGGTLRRYAELDAADRARLRTSLGAALSEMRRQAEREGGALTPLLSAAREIPSWDCAMALDGRPVLAAWGHAPAGGSARGLIAALDDGVPAVPPSTFPRGPVLATLLALLLLAALATATSRWWWPLAAPPMPACRIDPAALGALRGMLAEEGREGQLAAELGRLQGEIGIRQSECPIAELPPEPPPPPPPQRPPPPPPRPDPPPVRPPDAQPCDAETQSGGRGVTRTRHFLGNRPGRVSLNYDTRIEPDQIDVYYRGQLVSSTRGPVRGRGGISFEYRPTGGGPEANVVEVVVTGYGLTTRWSYTIGCPR